ncbi:hypothetical protein GCM10025884_13880 [Leuconostoc gelidum subsp. gelidum]|nr:hypothetical protein GCM10025884_13880 [Leuconostoc gelidum subsp. gelidum]
MFGLFSLRAAEAMSNFSVMIGDLQFDFFANRDGVKCDDTIDIYTSNLTYNI